MSKIPSAKQVRKKSTNFIRKKILKASKKGKSHCYTNHLPKHVRKELTQKGYRIKKHTDTNPNFICPYTYWEIKWSTKRKETFLKIKKVSSFLFLFSHNNSI